MNQKVAPSSCPSLPDHPFGAEPGEAGLVRCCSRRASNRTPIARSQTVAAGGSLEAILQPPPCLELPVFPPAVSVGAGAASSPAKPASGVLRASGVPPASGALPASGMPPVAASVPFASPVVAVVPPASPAPASTATPATVDTIARKPVANPPLSALSKAFALTGKLAEVVWPATKMLAFESTAMPLGTSPPAPPK